MKPPAKIEVDWTTPYEPGAAEPPMEQITKPSGHGGADFIARNHEVQQERRERYLRDYGGRERDARRIPPPEFQGSGKSYKAGSRIRYPSRKFLENFSLIDWSA